MNIMVVLKMTGTGMIIDSYGSHYDPKHTKQCILSSEYFGVGDKVYIANHAPGTDNYYVDILNKNTDIDTIIFGTMNKEILSFIVKNSKYDVYTWFNGHWNLPSSELSIDDLMKFVSAGFEQSNIVPKHEMIYHLPTGFQHDANIDPVVPEFHVMFSGTLFRTKRKISPHYRFDVLQYLLERGLSVLVFNGSADIPEERDYIDKLKSIGKNFEVVNSWASPSDYYRGYYTLNFPFHGIGGGDKGMGIIAYENTVWFHGWDIFRILGSGCNLITYDCDEIRNLGLNDDNCLFYKNSPLNVNGMCEDIFDLVLSETRKQVPVEVSSKHSYASRWNFILSKVNENKHGNIYKSSE